MNRLIRFTRRFFYNKGKEVWWFLKQFDSEYVKIIAIYLLIAIPVTVEIVWIGLSFSGVQSIHPKICFWFNISLIAGAFSFWIGKNVVKAWRETK